MRFFPNVFVLQICRTKGRRERKWAGDRGQKGREKRQERQDGERRKREKGSFWELYIEDIFLPTKAKIHQLKGQQAGEAPPEPGTSVEPHKGLSQVFLDPPRILPGVSRVEKTSECFPDVPSWSSGEGVVPDLPADRKCFYPKSEDLKKKLCCPQSCQFSH